MVRACLAGGFAVALAACAGPPHVTLHAPPHDASFAERRAAYDRLRPYLFAQVVSGSGHDSLELADGTVVYYIDDLSPLLADGSTAARAASDAASYQRRRNRFAYAGTASFLGGLALIIGQLAAGSDWAPGYQVGAAGVVAGPLLWLPAWYYGRKTKGAQRLVFRSFDESLRARLGLCVNRSLRFVDCPRR